MKELRDQSIHTIAAMIILLPALLFPNLVSGAFSGFMIGFVREITEEGTPVTFEKMKSAFNSRLDLTFWTFGGAIAGLVA